MRQVSSTSLSARTNHKAEDFALEMNPDMQMQICHDERDCIMGEYPTLSQVKRDYGSNAPEIWLVPQLANLSEYCGARDKLTRPQLRELAWTIAHDFHYLKVSELMLFFRRFKSGRYGRFYGSVDPLVITKALRDFVAERNNAIDHYEREEKKRRLEEDRKDACTWKEYCMMSGQPERIHEHPLQRPLGKVVHQNPP